MDANSVTPLAESKPKERRRTSQAGLLDSGIRMVAQLAASNDVQTRSLANRALADLQKLRHQLPKRRQIDTSVRQR